MDLTLPPAPSGYTSPGRRSGAAAEQWVREEAYCPRCASSALGPTPVNAMVIDLVCARCSLALQVKAKSGEFGRKFANSAYEPKVEAIRARRMPDYALVVYDPAAWAVRRLTFLPGFLLTESAIERRNPLSPTARRAGWVGSNVVLAALPPDAKVDAVREGVPRKPADVKREYARFEHLRKARAMTAGWTMDVLKEVRDLAPVRGSTFTLQDLYAASEARLQALHPENRHVKQKVRQQLQALRDRGVLDFTARGRYRVVG